jgi:protein-L-isoaspartate O-methyltransferase
VVEEMRSLVSELKEKRGMSSRVEAAFLTVDRTNFARDKRSAYRDTSDGFGLDAASWSLGLMNAAESALKDGSRCLVMDSWPGYEAALLSQLAGECGRVVAQESSDDRLKEVKMNLLADNPKYVESGRVIPVVDGTNTPCRDHAPCSVIIDKCAGVLNRDAYQGVLAPDGIVVCRSDSTRRENWTGFRKLPSGGMEPMKLQHMPEDTSRRQGTGRFSSTRAGPLPLWRA